jgi:hypothetical protein
MAGMLQVGLFSLWLIWLVWGWVVVFSGSWQLVNIIS